MDAQYSTEALSAETFTSMLDLSVADPTSSLSWQPFSDEQTRLLSKLRLSEDFLINGEDSDDDYVFHFPDVGGYSDKVYEAFSKSKPR